MGSVVVEERLKLAAGIPLSVGAHQEPEGDQCPTGWCVMEKMAWITGYDRWTDDPENCSRAISAFLRRFNDGLDDEGRDRLDRWMLANVDALVATADDGLDERRRYLCAEWSAHKALVVWLEIAGDVESLKRVHALPAITDASSLAEWRESSRELCETLWDRRREARERLAAKVKTAVAEEIAKHPGKPAAAAVAVAAAAAAAVVDAVAAAVAVADADADAAAAAAAAVAADAAVAAAVDAVAAAVAVADAVADADADAAAAVAAAAAVDAVAAAAAAVAAVAVAVADAAVAADARWLEARDAVYVKVRDRYRAEFQERYGEVTGVLRESAFGLLDELVGLEGGKLPDLVSFGVRDA